METVLIFDVTSGKSNIVGIIHRNGSLNYILLIYSYCQHNHWEWSIWKEEGIIISTEKFLLVICQRGIRNDEYIKERMKIPTYVLSRLAPL